MRDDWTEKVEHAIELLMDAGKHGGRPSLAMTYLADARMAVTDALVLLQDEIDST
jgi:hypothetical protein